MDALFVWYVWLAVALITLILEVFTSGFVIGCFSVGALVSAIVAALGGGMNAQLIVFAAVTVGVFAFIRPFALKYLLRARNRVATNNDALIGRTGQVVTAIDNAAMRGEVRVDGDISRRVRTPGQLSPRDAMCGSWLWRASRSSSNRSRALRRLDRGFPALVPAKTLLLRKWFRYERRKDQRQTITDHKPKRLRTLWTDLQQAR